MHDYPQVERGLACAPVQEPKRAALKRERQYLLDRVSDIDRALALFEKYPEVEELQDLLRRI